ncbi:hypothetical protein LOTGIDRAFT_167671 [Lottia gigantea]|uniref:C-type lectin domain-containing protein n=1 Tax=Lottia gigantea TaxID=225164 RepID=V4BAE3_LOTGI|nr:hypothetical protein LOTGIDRAFT_167671 [Lottia gigantea]ESO85914.1 hypothetical protein LOTGIDRAFT_167671 [Lottia gigantea]
MFQYIFKEPVATTEGLEKLKGFCNYCSISSGSLTMDIGTQKMLLISVILFAGCAADLYLLRRPTHDDLKFDGYTLENLVNIPTIPFCAFRCYVNTACVSVFYNKIFKSCVLKSVLFMNLQDGIVESGTKYYSVYEDGCPQDFIRNRKYDLCYNTFLAYVERNEAKELCAENGYVLLRGTSVDAYNHVSNQLMVTPGNAYGYYIGGSDKITEGRWIFDDGEIMTAFIWGDGEPDNHTDKDVLYLIRLGNGKYEMSDIQPHTRFNYICQKL